MKETMEKIEDLMIYRGGGMEQGKLEVILNELVGDQISVIISEIEDWEILSQTTSGNKDYDNGWNKCLDNVLVLLQSKL